MKPSPGVMWGTATLMVTLVSCCSLIGISIMPLISGPSYKTFITLFTGLAVGSLLGSAIFSLIPQAFSLHLQADKAYLWKSLIIFVGIYLFYCSERLMRLYFAKKSQKKLKQEQVELNKKGGPMPLDACEENENENDAVDDDDNGNGNTVVSAKERVKSSNKLSGNQTPVPHTSIIERIGKSSDSSEREDDRAKERSSTSRRADSQVSLSHQHLNQHSHDHHLHHHHNHNHLNQHEVLTKALESNRNSPLPKRHAVDGIAPVAWMIIIGDGLHNFIDGLSIGAAFSESIYQGMSICIAVIFEEFPHELGDFAVLIASGMTARQALGYNFLSACTCYIGMIVGILLGDLTSSATYIFALAAGMFFYISLVDMMGELNAALEECRDSTKESLRLLLMQNIGILAGITIIFSLSLFGPSA